LFLILIGSFCRYGALFEDDVNIKFARNWKLPVENAEENAEDDSNSEKAPKELEEPKTVPYRTTWSAGWFLEHQHNAVLEPSEY
jgi:hypothetical protein